MTEPEPPLRPASRTPSAGGEVGRRRRPVRGGALDRRRRARGPGLVRHRQPAAVADPQGRRADRGGRQRRLRPHRPRRRHRPAPGRRAARAAVAARRPGLRVRTLFLDASTEILVLRYKVGRRRHPLSVGSLTDAVERERQVLEPVRAVADLVVDTTNLNVHQLRDRVLEAFAQAGGDPDPAHPGGVVRLQAGRPHRRRHGARLPLPAQPPLGRGAPPALGTRRGGARLRPGPADDRPVPRPARVAVRPAVPAFVAEGKTYLTIAFGCTGGRHRSVAIAEEVGRMLCRARRRAPGRPPRHRRATRRGRQSGRSARRHLGLVG